MEPGEDDRGGILRQEKSMKAKLKCGKQQVEEHSYSAKWGKEILGLVHCVDAQS